MNKKNYIPNGVSLKALIRKEFVRSALIPIAIIEILLLVLYFSINYYKDIKTKNTLLAEVKENITEISFRETQKINTELNQISDIANILKTNNERIFEHPELAEKPLIEPQFDIAQNGVIYKTIDNGGSSIYVSALNKMNPQLLKKLHFTEAFDPLYKNFTDNNELIVAIYINTWDNMNRYYPFIPNVWEQYEAAMNIPDFNFYYLADSTHNPDKNIIWTDAYLDPAGQGWMASCIVPIYKGDFLEGVTGIDITIDKFVHNILNMTIPWNGQAFLVDEKGSILAMPEGIETLFDLKELSSHSYEQTIKENTYKPDRYNIIKNDNIPASLKNIFEDKTHIQEIDLKENKYILSQEIIPETGWRLFFVIDENAVFQPVYELYTTGLWLGLGAIVFLILFYIPFFVYLLRKANKTAETITSPLTYLVEASTRMSNDIHSFKTRIESVGVREMDELSVNFNQMTEELQKLYQQMDDKINKTVDDLRTKDHLLIKQSRQAAMGEMIGNIAHQWRQPLNSIGVIIQNLEDAYEFGEMTEQYLKNNIAQIMNMLQYMSQTIDDFRNFFKPNKEKELFKVLDILQNTVTLVKSEFDSEHIAIQVDNTNNPVLKGYPNELSQVMLNLLINTKDVVKERALKQAKISISIEINEQLCSISIEDDAGGIPSEIIDHIFEPYFTTKDMGTGLGLYMSQMIIEKNMKGTIHAENTQSGARFTINLPNIEDDAKE